MKKWHIVLLAGLAALLCGCFGLLFGFAVGYGMGGRRAPSPAPDRGMHVVVAAQNTPAVELGARQISARIGRSQEFGRPELARDYVGLVGARAGHDLSEGVPTAGDTIPFPP